MVNKYGAKNWKLVSGLLGSRSPVQCLHRWTKILKPGLIKGPWTIDEDRKLINWVNQFGAYKWSHCSSLIKGRNGKQCRERWFNTLNPNVKKGNWSKEEDFYIFKYFNEYGSKWSKISQLIQGRTENAIKNRFYSTLRRFAADNCKNGTSILTNFSLDELLKFFPEAYEEKKLHANMDFNENDDRNNIQSHDNSYDNTESLNFEEYDLNEEPKNDVVTISENGYTTQNNKDNELNTSFENIPNNQNYSLNYKLDLNSSNLKCSGPIATKLISNMNYSNKPNTIVERIETLETNYNTPKLNNIGSNTTQPNDKDNLSMVNLLNQLINISSLVKSTKNELIKFERYRNSHFSNIKDYNQLSNINIGNNFKL